MTEDDVILQENFLPSRDWSLCRHVITSQGTDTSRACDHSVYSIHFHVKRKSQFYLWSVVLVLVGLCIYLATHLKIEGFDSGHVVGQKLNTIHLWETNFFYSCENGYTVLT